MSNNALHTKIGQAYLDALAERDFERIEELLHPNIRFRGLIPRAVREASTAQEAVSWLRSWFETAEAFILTQYSIDQVIDRLHIAYRVLIHVYDGWHEFAQQLYCSVEHDLIVDMSLLCSGFRPLPDEPLVQQGSDTSASTFSQNGTEATLICDVGDRGCTEGPLEQIARLARSLSGKQTLEVRATNPSVAHDLPAWCRLAGYELLKQDGDRYVIGRPNKEV